ncbi:zinc finger C-x8-C-x5-C-x3-H type, putative [Plasmodium gallinaceum]|uniref:Zinc finger C-x8-C-x5-C-x3-H type, putative n=1 Tax=Plasmodium gallinaceum TaxID=5849 RepID=A0A1J1GNT5_PLAGA|nr:zinc finger C-x8-C-x5-C-x3-H type, putative [Plasmodium gallinaceum]CRG94143.1 zinc finger C-x8-C-x5-C-x3-H type, putative [Plasmodium gallinaceum]
MSVSSEIKYQFARTKICKHFLENKCLNKDNCNYAHVLEELRPLPNLINTKLCKSLKKNEVCNIPNCKYAHKIEHLQPSTNLSTYKTTMCYFWKKKKCMNESKCRFAHGIKEIRPLNIKKKTVKEKNLLESKENVDLDTDECIRNLLSNVLFFENLSTIKKDLLSSGNDFLNNYKNFNLDNSAFSISRGNNYSNSNYTEKSEHHSLDTFFLERNIPNLNYIPSKKENENLELLSFNDVSTTAELNDDDYFNELYKCIKKELSKNYENICSY